MIPIVDGSSIGFSCGVDLVDIASFERAIDVTAGRLREVCFTHREQQEAAGRLDRLATRWAVKEAVAKALGIGLLQGFGFHDVEVMGGDGRAVEVALHREARELAKRQHLDRWAISVSHEGGFAIAIVIATDSCKPSQDISGEDKGDG